MVRHPPLQRSERMVLGVGGWRSAERAMPSGHCVGRARAAGGPTKSDPVRIEERKLMAKGPKAPKTDVATSPSPTVTAHQHKNLSDENRALKARVRVLEEQLGYKPRSLVLELAEALADAADAAAVAPPPQSLNDGGHTRPTSRPPAGGNQGARRAKRGLETAVGRAITTYWSRRFWDYERPHTPRPQGTESVRCRTRECSRRDRRTPRYIRAGESTIEMSHCPECGSRLTPVSD